MVIPPRTTVMLCPAAIVTTPLRLQSTVVEFVTPQLPTCALGFAVVSITEELANVSTFVSDGNVIVIRLLANCERPPVAEVVNPIVYTVRALAASDGEMLAVSPVTGIGREIP